MNRANYSPIEIETFKELLTERGPPDIYFVVRRVSKSGMSRVISFYYFSADGGCHCLDQIICQLGDFSYSEKAEGCGYTEREWIWLGIACTALWESS